jgi:hypothetical protein
MGMRVISEVLMKTGYKESKWNTLLMVSSFYQVRRLDPLL